MVLRFFLENLAPEWEIYVQPHLNGLRPDFVLLNPSVGIAVFEVKNWDFSAMRYFPKRVSSRRIELWGERDGKEFSLETENPFYKVALYKERIFNLYCPRLQQKLGFAAITGGVIFPSADGNRARNLQRAFLTESEAHTAGTYLPISGRSELMGGEISKVFPHSGRAGSRLMTPALAEDLRGWLVEPDFSREQREPLPLDSRQRRLSETRTQNGFRRIKGPAGSGKSLVLAARAARLASEGKSVLIVTYNITLWHYLRDLIRRNVSRREDMKNIVFAHFHDWCRDICEKAKLGTAYDELFLEVQKVEDSNLPEQQKRQRISELLEGILDRDVPLLASHAAMSPLAPRYDAILVDEGQDFIPLWWSALKNCRKGGEDSEQGEMVLVADTTQDIYNKSRTWTDDAMSGAGFTGDWARLEGSYRLPPEAIQAVRDFALNYLAKDKIDIPDGIQGDLGVEPCTLRWVQCNPGESQSQCVDAILSMMRETGSTTESANADITFICNDINFGRGVTDALDKYDGIQTVHTFERDSREQKRKKMGFWKGDARIKATTLHSFKGWETRLLVVHIGHAKGEDSLSSIYAGLTRLKRSPVGSWLTVVSSAPELAEFGKTWPTYQNLVSDELKPSEDNPYLVDFSKLFGLLRETSRRGE